MTSEERALFRRLNLIIIIGIVNAVFMLLLIATFMLPWLINDFPANGVGNFFKSEAEIVALSEEPAIPPEQPQIVDFQEENQFDEFGFPAGSYHVRSGVVNPNQSLFSILSRMGVSPQEITKVVGLMQAVFNARHIRSGQRYHGYFTADGQPPLLYFIYEISANEFLKLDFTDSLQVFRKEKQLVSLTRAASGIIQSSLWDVMKSQGINKDLVSCMSEALSAEIDLSVMQPGDRFKVIYNEDYAGERAVGVSRIDAIYLFNQGREFYGFYFEKDSLAGFYNEQGESLRRMFLKSPLANGEITSGYSNSRFHPMLRRRVRHLGTDYAAPHGTPIMAVGDGVVSKATYNPHNGYYVRIRHDEVYETKYLHMSRFASGIRPGSPVAQGQVIGYVGSSGMATGPHVCFRFIKNGMQVDHLREAFPMADALPEAYQKDFSIHRDRVKMLFDQIPFMDEQLAMR